MTDTKLFLTIATTGLWDDDDPEFRPEIVQLSLASAEGDELLTKCIVPTGSFQPEASRFNGYTIRKTRNRKRKLLRNGKKVKTVPLKRAIKTLLKVIKAQGEQAPPGGRILLMGYNSKKYDIPVLENEMRECGLSTEPLNSVICADLYLLIRSKSHQILPNHRGDLKMTTIFNELCGRQERHMHNAVEDVQKLVAIYDEVKEFDIQPFTFQFKAFQGTKRKRASDTGDSLDDQDRAQKFSSNVSDVGVRQSKRVKTSPW